MVFERHRRIVGKASFEVRYRDVVSEEESLDIFPRIAAAICHDMGADAPVEHDVAHGEHDLDRLAQPRAASEESPVYVARRRQKARVLGCVGRVLMAGELEIAGAGELS